MKCEKCRLDVEIILFIKKTLVILILFYALITSFLSYITDVYTQYIYLIKLYKDVQVLCFTCIFWKFISGCWWFWVLWNHANVCQEYRGGIRSNERQNGGHGWKPTQSGSRWLVAEFNFDPCNCLILLRIMYIKDDVLSLKKFKFGFDFGNIDKKNVLGTVNKIIFTTAEWSRRILVKELMEEINEIISNCLSYHYVKSLYLCIFQWENFL